jgi:hypothetical protein
MSQVTIAQTTRAWANLEQLVRGVRLFIPVRDMLELAEDAGASEQGHTNDPMLMTFCVSIDVDLRKWCIRV